MNGLSCLSLSLACVNKIAYNLYENFALASTIAKLLYEKKEHYPISMQGEIKISIEDPYRNGNELIYEQKIKIMHLMNVAPILDDNNNHWLFCIQVIDNLKLLKERVNEQGGKLVFASVLRTWSNQMDLWKKYRLGIKGYNAANQPGTSWHETGRAIDISVWNLNMSGINNKPEIPIKQLRKMKFEDEEERKKAQYFYKQLEKFRGIAKRSEIGFETVWDKYPWNASYEKTRRAGNIISINHNIGLRYTFTFNVTDAMPNKIMVLPSVAEIIFRVCP